MLQKISALIRFLFLAKNPHPRGNRGNARGPPTAFRHAVRPLRQIFTGLSHCWRVALLLAVGVSFEGCGGGGAVTGPPPPPPPPSIMVRVTPQSSPVLLGTTRLFAADVTTTSNTTVTWSVNGVAGGNSAVGAISATGLYAAPADLPSNATVTIAAASVADQTKSGSAQVTVTSDIAVSITPGGANVELGSVQKLQSSVTSSSGHPDTTILWSLGGAACPSACGTVDTNGNYTAPQILPSTPSVMVRAQSVADPSKFAVAALKITSSFALQLSGPTSIATTASATIVATLTPIPNSNPNSTLSWSLSGTGCGGSSCGTLATTTTQFDANNVEVSSADYAAPATAPTPNTVTITITPAADPTRKTQLTIQVQAGPSVGLSPVTVTVAANHRVTLTAQIAGTSNMNLNWFVNGTPEGNSTVGQICSVGLSPCQTVTGAGALQVDYVAPGAIPSPNPVTVAAKSAGDPTLQASSQITVINHVLVSVQPGNATLAPLAVQGFTATVLGTSNQAVAWQVRGSGCAGTGTCGTITPAGTYTAPTAAPTPDAIQVLAISADDGSQFGLANVSVSTR